MAEAIELVERDYPDSFVIPLHTRKLKLKDASFKGISGRWKKFRLDRLKKKLENKKEDLVEMEFSEKQLKAGKDRERTAARILSKTRAIAELESKINFLEKGEYIEQKIVDSRAIKLRKTMMENMMYNSDSVYSVSEEAANRIINSSIIDVDWDKTQNFVGAEVRKMMDQDAARKRAEEMATQQSQQTMQYTSQPVNGVPQAPILGTSATVSKSSKKATEEPTVVNNIITGDAQTDPFTESEETIQIAEMKNSGDGKQTNHTDDSVVSQAEVKGVIEEEMHKIDVIPPISEAEVKKAIEEEMREIEIAPPISADDIQDVVDDEMDKIKVTANDSRAARINPFISDDGTYHIKGEDIDEDFRITKIDRSVLEQPAATTSKQDLDSEKQGKNRKEKAESIFESAIPEPSDDTTDTIEIESTFPTDDEEQHDVEETKPQDERLTELMNKVRLLRTKQANLEEQQASAHRTAEDVDRKYDETVSELAKYASQLEQKCTDINEDVTSMRKATSEKEARIDAVLELLSSGDTETTKTETKGRAK